jgi:DNA-directed RNA polymerase beta subunit/DNA-directed RNA polymerase beta' subunit
MSNFDLEKQFAAIVKSATDAVKEIFPIEGKLRSIRLEKVWVEDNLSSTDYTSQAQAKNKETTWGAPVYATLSLVDKQTGKDVDKVEKVKLFTLPKLTERFSYIVGGNEYQVQSQLRLKPGVYTLRKQNGELKTQVNLSKGKNFDLGFNERTGVFSIQKVGGGQANVPLYPILTYLGVSPVMIADRWGGKLEAANRVSDPKAVQRAAAAFGVKTGSELKDYFTNTAISEETTKAVLGEAFGRVDGPMLLSASKNLLDVHLGDKPPTDRDSLAFKELHSVEDYLHERIQKNKQSLSFKLKRNIDNVRRTKLSQLINPGSFNSVVEGFFTQDDKSATPEQTNPLEMLTGQYRVTIMGSGGIKSDHAITPEMREIHPSHYGFLDPIHTPECYDEGTEVLTFHGWKKWQNTDIGDLFACRINGRLEYHHASKLHKSFYSGKMYGVQNGKIDYLVTPNHRMFVRPLESRAGAWRIESAEQTHNKPRTFCATHDEYLGAAVKRFALSHVIGGNASINVKDVDIEDWCEFVGWFVSEGCLTYDEKRSAYLIKISQCGKANPEKCKRIEALLNRLPWRWCRTKNKEFVIGVKQVAHYFKDQGLCNTKYIPRELFSAPVGARKKLMEAMLLGDGRTYSTRTKIPTYKQQVYCTTSPQLAKDFEQLATGLGHSVTISKYQDKREERYHDTYEIRILQNNIRSARKWNHRSKKNDYYTKEYEGFVYCATVPGGLLLVRRGKGIALWLGNSSKIGANLHLPLGTVKEGKELKTILLDRTGKPQTLDATSVFDKYVAFPGQKGDLVKAIYRGKVEEVSRSKVDFTTPSPQALLSWSTNLIPFLPSNQGNRAMMASKMLEQAISLKHREAPLVQVGFGATTTEKRIGEGLALSSPVDGVVKKLTKDAMIIRGDDGKDVKLDLYNNFTLNRKSFISHEALVKEGTRVKKGQLLADNNFTKGGELALGTNMRVAYLPYKGLNFEDGVVITSSAATKLTSEHIHKKAFELSDTIISNLSAFNSFYPNALTSENLRKFDKEGVIKKGARIKHGEALAALLQKRAASTSVASFSRVLSDRPKDVSMYWQLEDDGEVIDVQRSGNKVTVLVKTEEAAKIGDKLSGRMGNKGIITKIISDSEAPHDKSGKPVDILLNPHGVISRINIGQIYESAAGKVAQKTGKPIRVDNFSGENYLQSTRALLKQHGIDDKEELFDPITKKSLGKVHVGSPYIFKLFKQGTANFSVRQGGPGQPYDANQQPLKAGGPEAAKSMDLLTVYSMLSHGARANLREMASVKSNQNDEFWKALKSGQPLPQPNAPFVYEKFLSYLKGAGINPIKDGTKLVLAPLTDDDVRKQSNGEIKKNFFYRGKDMEPVRGGFFDKTLTGGFKGSRWNHIELKEPVINPVFENAVRKLTGLGKKLDDVISGKLHLGKDGTFNTDGKGLTGGHAIAKILKDIDVDAEYKSLERKSVKATGAALDDVNKRMRYLKALKDNKMKPEDAYMRKALPVLPPVYRPVYPLPDGSITTSDINILYQNTGVVNEMMHLPVMDMLHEEEKADIRKDLYEHVKNVSGLTDSNIKGRVRDGFISEIKGGSGGQPKEGFFISKMLSKKQDFVGRGTIIPEPELGVDQVALPEEMAWKLFDPFIVRELRNHGKMPLQAAEEIKQKTPLARRALDLVMKERHVLLNRAPSLHKFSIMAFKPVITTGRAIKIPPLVVKGFNADFDGDCFANDYIYLHDGELTERLTAEDFARRCGVTDEELAASDAGVLQVDFPDGGLKVLALNTSTGVPELQQVTALTLHFNHKDVYEVKTASGRIATITDDHSLITMGSTGTFKTFSPVSEGEQYCITAKKISLPPVASYKGFTLDFDLGFVLGHWSSDGCFAVHKKKDGTVYGVATRWHSTELEINTALEAAFNSLGWKYSVRKLVRDNLKDHYTYNVAGKTVRDFILELCGNFAAHKRLPEHLILNSNDDFRQGLLSGVMSGDGGCSEGSSGQTSVDLKVNSEEFCLTTEILLQTLGVSFSKTKHANNRFELTMRMPIPPSAKGPVQASRRRVWEKAQLAYKTKYDCVPTDPVGLKALLKSRGIKVSMLDFEHSFLKRGREKTRLICIRFAKKYRALLADSPYARWADVVLNEAIQFDKVISVCKVERPHVMYDLSVPSSETFFLSDSVLSKNTMTVHVPITDEANEEAKRMLPSRNLFQAGTDKLMIAPSQEAQIGIYYLSTTSVGRAQLNKILGSKYAISDTLDKKATGTLLHRIAKEVPPQDYARMVGDLKKAGEGHAYDRGFTLGLNDLADISKARDKIVDRATKQSKGVTDAKRLAVINKESTDLLDHMISVKLKGTNNPLFDMVESGARGEKSQLRSIVATPLFVTDARGNTIARPIKKSYAEGLDVSDYWLSMYGARKGGMDRSIQTSLPGAFSKDIMASTIDNVVSGVDCGTKDGIKLKVEDRDALDRYLAGSQGGLAHNTLISGQVLNQLKKAGLQEIKVRSPLTCHQSRGVCAKCHGLDEHGELPGMGENVGAKAGQTISEPLVQMIMNTRHTGGVAGTGSNAGGYARINQLLQLPKIVSGAATLAPHDGTVTKIEAGLAGGFNVYVGRDQAYVSAGLPLKVKVGSTVQAGDALSEGVIKPQDLVKHKGMQPAQEYIVDALQSTYKAQGVTIQKRVFETIVRSLGNTTRVVNNPKNSEHLPGDVMAYTVAQSHNRNLMTAVPVDECVGYRLLEEGTGLKVGKELTRDDMVLLKSKGYKEVKIEKDAIQHTPFLKGMSALPLLKKDWMGALGYRYLAKSLTEGASQRWETDLSGHHPIPALAHGSTFGKGKEGKY